MGAGCMYTNKWYINNKVNKCRAVWLEVDPEDEFEYGDVLDNLFNDLKGICNTRYYCNTDKEIETPLYKVSFESTYDGDGIIIKQQFLYNDYDYLDPEELKLQSLASTNFERNYYSMINKLVKLGYTFRIATSGYTSGEYSEKIQTNAYN